MNQVDLTDVCRTFHQYIKEDTFFLAVHRTFSKTKHMLRHKAHLSNYSKAEITFCILFDHKRIKLVVTEMAES